MGWMVERFANGTWSTGGNPRQPECDNSKVFWLPNAASRDAAKKKAQGMYSRLKKQFYRCGGCEWLGKGIDLDHSFGDARCPNCDDSGRLEKCSSSKSLN